MGRPGRGYLRGACRLRCAEASARLCGRRVVFLAAHPDDEKLACGALIARMSQMGGDAEVVIATGGQRRVRGSHPLEATRAADAEQALSALAVRPAMLVQRRFEERLLERDEGLPTLELEARLLASYAVIVITTSAWEAHSDHAALGRATRVAVSSIGSIEVYEQAVPEWPWRSPSEGKSPGGGALRMDSGTACDDLILAWISVGDFIRMVRAQRVGPWRLLRWSVGVRAPVGPYQESKRSALACHRSQVHRSACGPLGVEPAAGTASRRRSINTTLLSYLFGPDEVPFPFDAHPPRWSRRRWSRTAVAWTGAPDPVACDRTLRRRTGM